MDVRADAADDETAVRPSGPAWLVPCLLLLAVQRRCLSWEMVLVATAMWMQTPRGRCSNGARKSASQRHRGNP